MNALNLEDPLFEAMASADDDFILEMIFDICLEFCRANEIHIDSDTDQMFHDDLVEYIESLLYEMWHEYCLRSIQGQEDKQAEFFSTL